MKTRDSYWLLITTTVLALVVLNGCKLSDDGPVIQCGTTYSSEVSSFSAVGCIPPTPVDPPYEPGGLECADLLERASLAAFSSEGELMEVLSCSHHIRAAKEASRSEDNKRYKPQHGDAGKTTRGIDQELGNANSKADTAAAFSGGLLLVRGQYLKAIAISSPGTPRELDSILIEPHWLDSYSSDLLSYGKVLVHEDLVYVISRLVMNPRDGARVFGIYPFRIADNKFVRLAPTYMDARADSDIRLAGSEIEVYSKLDGYSLPAVYSYADGDLRKGSTIMQVSDIIRPLKVPLTPTLHVHSRCSLRDNGQMNCTGKGLLAGSASFKRDGELFAVGTSEIYRHDVKSGKATVVQISFPDEYHDVVATADHVFISTKNIYSDDWGLYVSAASIADFSEEPAIHGWTERVGEFGRKAYDPYMGLSAVGNKVAVSSDRKLHLASGEGVVTELSIPGAPYWYAWVRALDNNKAILFTDAGHLRAFAVSTGTTPEILSTLENPIEPNTFYTTTQLIESMVSAVQGGGWLLGFNAETVDRSRGWYDRSYTTRFFSFNAESGFELLGNVASPPGIPIQLGVATGVLTYQNRTFVVSPGALQEISFSGGQAAPLGSALNLP